MSDTPSYDPTPKPASKGLPPALAGMSNSTLHWGEVVGGALAAIGTLLPWVSVKSTFISTSQNGWGDGWGWLIFILGLLVAALAFTSIRNIPIPNVKLPSWTSLALSAVVLLVVVIRIISLAGQ